MKLIYSSIIAVLFVGCSEDFIATYCPSEGEGNDWLSEMIKDFKRSDQAAEVYYYEYNGESVFSVNSCVGCADAMTVVYNCQKEVICQFGGIAGLNTCPDFDDQAKEKTRLYPKK